MRRSLHLPVLLDLRHILSVILTIVSPLVKLNILYCQGMSIRFFNDLLDVWLKIMISINAIICSYSDREKHVYIMIYITVWVHLMPRIQIGQRSTTYQPSLQRAQYIRLPRNAEVRSGPGGGVTGEPCYLTETSSTDNFLWIRFPVTGIIKF